MSTLTINGKTYKQNQLNETAKTHLESVKQTDIEIRRIQNLIAMNQTAKNAYSISVLNNLPEKTAAANRKNGIVSVNDKKYLVDDLNDTAKTDLFILNSIEKKLVELQTELKIANTAKNAYSKVLQDSLEK